MQQDAEFSVRVSFLELYNEDIFDLLSATDDLTKLRLYEDSARKGSVIIQVSWERDEDLFVVAIQLVVVLVVNLSLCLRAWRRYKSKGRRRCTTFWREALRRGRRRPPS